MSRHLTPGEVIAMYPDTRRKTKGLRLIADDLDRARGAGSEVGVCPKVRSSPCA